VLAVSKIFHVDHLPGSVPKNKKSDLNASGVYILGKMEVYSNRKHFIFLCLYHSLATYVHIPRYVQSSFSVNESIFWI
jgi:hypothetical protein